MRIFKPSVGPFLQPLWAFLVQHPLAAPFQQLLPKMQYPAYFRHEKTSPATWHCLNFPPSSWSSTKRTPESSRLNQGMHPTRLRPTLSIDVIKHQTFTSLPPALLDSDLPFPVDLSSLVNQCHNLPYPLPLLAIYDSPSFVHGFKQAVCFISNVV